MPGEVWIPEAETLKPVGRHNPMSGVGGPRATLHCTVSQPGSFDAMVRVLRDKEAESHLVYDPKTDRLGQFFPLDRAARALSKGALAYSHNRVGSVNIQIEVCAMPVDWTEGWNPGPNFRAMMRAVRSWGIADEFVFRPARTGGDRANVVRPARLLTSTEGGGLWWGHCHYPAGESHWDPGPINLDRFFGAAPVNTEEDDLMAVTVKNPNTGDEWPLEKALWSIWTYAIEAKRDASSARQLAEAAALKGSPLTSDEVKAALKAALSEDVELAISVKGGQA